MHDRLTWTEQTLSLKCCQGTTSDYGEFFNEQYKCPISSTTNYTERGKQQQWWKTIVLHCLEDLICFIILSSLSAIMMLFLTTQTKEMVCNKNKQTNKQTTHTHTGSAGTFNCLSSLQMYFQQSCARWSLSWLLRTATIAAASTGQFLGSAGAAPTSQGLLIGAQLWPQPPSRLQTKDLLSVPRHASHPATPGMGTSVGCTGSSLALPQSNSPLAASYQLNHYLQ